MNNQRAISLTLIITGFALVLAATILIVVWCQSHGLTTLASFVPPATLFGALIAMRFVITAKNHR